MNLFKAIFLIGYCICIYSNDAIFINRANNINGFSKASVLDNDYKKDKSTSQTGGKKGIYTYNNTGKSNLKYNSKSKSTKNDNAYNNLSNYTGEFQSANSDNSYYNDVVITEDSIVDTSYNDPSIDKNLDNQLNNELNNNRNIFPKYFKLNPFKKRNNTLSETDNDEDIDTDDQNDVDSDESDDDYVNTSSTSDNKKEQIDEQEGDDYDEESTDDSNNNNSNSNVQHNINKNTNDANIHNHTCNCATCHHIAGCCGCRGGFGGASAAASSSVSNKNIINLSGNEKYPNDEQKHEQKQEKNDIIPSKQRAILSDASIVRDLENNNDTDTDDEDYPDDLKIEDKAKSKAKKHAEKFDSDEESEDLALENDELTDQLVDVEKMNNNLIKDVEDEADTEDEDEEYEKEELVDLGDLLKKNAKAVKDRERTDNTIKHNEKNILNEINDETEMADEVEPRELIRAKPKRKKVVLCDEIEKEEDKANKLNAQLKEKANNVKLQMLDQKIKEKAGEEDANLDYEEEYLTALNFG